jgi:heme/copper-type cytochrome/quinol oxidase subunit 2
MRIRFAILAVALIGFLSMARGTYAQGCALCYTTAAAAGPAAARSLDLGILALVTPALVLFLAVIFLLFRRAATATV